MNENDSSTPSLLLDPASTAAAAIAHLQSQLNVQNNISTTANGTQINFDDSSSIYPAVTPESIGDADSGVETKSIDIKSESDHCMMNQDPDSGDDLPPMEPAANARILDVRCGNLTGKLYEERFTCPGIHKKCIEFDGRLVSPREFTIRAEKDKQKDWKGSIRVGRYNLRTLMEMKKIDFYDHESNCSLKCQSRNYIKNRKQAAIESSMNFLDTLVKNGATITSAASDLSGVDQQPSSSASTFNDFNISGTNDENGFNGSRKGSSALEEYVSRMSTSSTSSTATLAKMVIKNEQHLEQEPRKQSTPQPHHIQPQTPQTLPAFTPDPNTVANLLWKQLNGQLPPAFQGIFKQQQQAPPPPAPPIIPQENDQVTALVNSLLEQQKGLLQNQFNNSGLMGNNSFNTSGNGGAATTEDILRSGEALNGNALKRIMEQQPTMFWERMRELNLVDDLASHISAAVDQLKSIYRSADPRTDAFGMFQLFNSAFLTFIKAFEQF
uniref:SAND domain-containing protein n=1 Tax=Panagrolaimus superbus TaxID=310955 RepID=A0A914Y0D4_9BILA